jgi:uncharacterized protein
MKEELRTLILYRLERAHESLEEALLLREQGYANTYVNRLYYACFYAVSALLLAKGFSSAKHSGIRSLLHQEVIKPGLLDRNAGKLYDRLFDSRQQGDYQDLFRFDLKEVSSWYDEARQFVKTTEHLIQEPERQE